MILSKQTRHITFKDSLKQVTSFHQHSARLLSKSLAVSFCPLSINKASITSGPALVTELATILRHYEWDTWTVRVYDAHPAIRIYIYINKYISIY